MILYILIALKDYKNNKFDYPKMFVSNKIDLQNINNFTAFYNQIRLDIFLLTEKKYHLSILTLGIIYFKINGN